MRSLIATVSMMFVLGVSAVASAQAVELPQAASLRRPVPVPVPPRRVPELDGSAAALALGLVGAGLAIAHGRRRRARTE